MLETFRDKDSGSITVKGKGFAVRVTPEGRVIAEGQVTVEPPPSLPMYDTPSPRSRPASRKRGAR
jgi:hypothetical protein